MEAGAARRMGFVSFETVVQRGGLDTAERFRLEEKATPVVRRGRKATGLANKTAGLPTEVR